MAASYEARARGVRSGMGAAQARRLCPDAVAVPPDFPAYVEASDALFELFEDTAPVVERLSMEEAFLDVRGLEAISGSPVEIASRLRQQVWTQLHLPLSVGVARTKFLAKLASRAAKPDGMRVVDPERELEFLHPLQVEQVWGVGPATARRLNDYGIATVGQLAAIPEPALVAMLGRAAGRHLHALANNRDPRPVLRGGRRGSFGSQHALGRWSGSLPELDATLVSLVDRVTRRMRAAQRAGRTVVLRLRFADFTRATRSHTLPRATAATVPVLTTVRVLLTVAMPTIERRGLTLVGVAVTGLDPRASGVQMTLPVQGAGGEALDRVLDELRDRFGSDAVTRAVQLGRGSRLHTWLLPGDRPGTAGAFR
jgi:DNA polymerase-4